MSAYRAETVGSLLRPGYLLDARERYAAGELDDAELRAFEDRAVDECLALQEATGLDVVSDGEMRRNVFASQLVQATEGFGPVEGNYVEWHAMDGTIERDRVTVALISPIRRLRDLSSEEFVYCRAKSRQPVKVTLPSPTMYAYYWLPGTSDSAYTSPEVYMEAVTEILKDEVNELVRLGCRYIQFDAPEYGMILDQLQQQWFRKKGFTPEYMVEDGIEMINAIISDHNDSNVTFALHICRGNDANRYMAAGGYDLIARKVFQRCNVQRLLLEYDDDRSGDFAPLAEVPEDKTVVLGLVSTKHSELETDEEIVARIQAASRYVPLDRLALSPQCGFASVAAGNHLSREAQEAKLRLVGRVARRVWAD